MATKSEYLATLAGLSYIQAVGTAVENEGESIPELLLTTYNVYVLERSNGEGVSVNHIFLVYDEGGGSEEVLTSYIPIYKENDSINVAIRAYIDALTAVKEYWIRTYNGVKQCAIIRALVFITDHIDIKWYLIYNDNGLTHSEINNPEDF